MPQTITTGYKALVDAAEREIETLPIEDAIKLAGRDDTVLVDIRDVRELQREGKVPGAFHCPRGMLEFWIDPQSPYHKPVFALGQDASCSSAPRAGARRWRRRPRTAWGSSPSPISRAASAPGRNPAARSRRRKPSRASRRRLEPFAWR